VVENDHLVADAFDGVIKGGLVCKTLCDAGLRESAGDGGADKLVPCHIRNASGGLIDRGQLTVCIRAMIPSDGGIDKSIDRAGMPPNFSRWDKATDLAFSTVSVTSPRGHQLREF